MKDKKEQIEAWIEKGAEWCAKQLWTRTKSENELRQEVKRCRKTSGSDWGELQRLKNENQNLAKVLELNGIRPVLLRVTYSIPSCYGCSLEEERESGEVTPEDCYYCNDYEKREEIKIETISFYAYEIERAEISGITGTFRDLHLDVLEVSDTKTGKIIWSEENGFLRDDKEEEEA